MAPLYDRFLPLIPAGGHILDAGCGLCQQAPGPAWHRQQLPDARRLRPAPRDDRLTLPADCYVNYDLAIIDFLIRLQGKGPTADYQSLKASLGWRPTLTEPYRSASSMSDLPRQHGQWRQLVRDQDDLSATETACLERHDTFLKEVESTNMVRSIKAVLRESLLDNDGFRNPPTIDELAAQALDVFRRRRGFIGARAALIRTLQGIPMRQHGWDRGIVWHPGYLKIPGQFALGRFPFRPGVAQMPPSKRRLLCNGRPG